ncbi:podocan [Halichoeres trimaculatus]|uniref:podocan n=1 Tax=Halichoeres trimaculatus TaxID=147232 RepID=UPI003D9DD2D5
MPEEEEREGRLVAGLNLQEKEGREVQIHTTPKPVTQNPETSSPLHHLHHPSVPVPPVPPHPQLTSLIPPHPTGRSALTVKASLFEDLLSEVFQSPGHHLRLNELEEKTNPEEEVVTSVLLKPAWTEETTSDVNKKEEEVKPEGLKDPHPVLRSTGKNLRAKPVHVKPTGETTLQENKTKAGVKSNKTTPQSRPVKPSTRQQPTKNRTTPNRSGNNKTTKTPKDKMKKKNKTQKPPQKKKEEEEEADSEPHFLYFKDEYCPPECACYGRVVQCSDKGLDKVPYGIPYNTRYILLMNNLIDRIQLDLLDEYVSMEFLVLSNNRLTDGAIEGAFEGIPALKRLYLDRNLLGSVPNDLPVSLEELRLDNNLLRVMSEAVWARCPGLLVLSLSNNSLGNGSESLPDRVFSPLSNLRTLNLDQNQLTAVPLGLPRSIRELYFKGNLIEHFRAGALERRSELLLLDLSANRLTNKGLHRDSLLNASHLESLNLEGNRLKQVPKHLPRSLKTLNLEGNLISSVKKAVFSSLKNLEHLGLARNKIFKVAPGAFRALLVLHQLDLSHNTLRQVPRQLPAALHSVALTHNRIQSVPRDAFCWGSESLSGLVRVQLEHNLIDMGRLDAQAFRCLRGFQVVHFY